MCVLKLVRTSVASLSVVLAVTTTVAAAPPPTSAQRSLVRSFMRGDVPRSGEAEQAVLAVTTEAFQAMLQSGADKAAAAGKARYAFQQTYMAQPPRNQNAFEARKTFVLACKSLATRTLTNPDVKPHSKANVTALLAELDERVDGSTPVPASAVMGTLYQYATQESQPLYIRSIALYGLERHLGYRWATLPENSRASVAGAIAKIVASEPKSRVDVPAHAWLVRRAYDTLGTVRSDLAKAKAIEHLTARETAASIRLSSAQYLSKLDLSALEEKEKIDVLVGLSYMLRQHLVMWYEIEEARLQIAAGGGMAAGGYGGGYGGEGGGPGMGGPGMGGGGYGGGGPGGMGGDGGDGGYGGMGGGEGGYGGGGFGGGSTRTKPVDTQSWETIAARRVVNQLAQAVHLALDGIPLPESDKSPAVIKPLVSAQLPALHEELTRELAELLDALQIAANDASTITDVRGLLQGVKTPIEDIMLHVLKIPEFTVRYPEILEEEGLDEIPSAVVPATGDPANQGDGLPASDGLPALDGSTPAGAPTGDPSGAQGPR